LSGFDGNDKLIGGNGYDTLDGGAGNDTLIGGGGSDSYYLTNSGNDVIVEDAVNDVWIDTVYSGSTVNSLWAGIEALTLLGDQALNGQGNDLGNVLLGNGASNQLVGLAGNDTLDGGAGDDLLSGGAGNDLYRIRAGSGRDTIRQARGATPVSGEFDTLDLYGGAPSLIWFNQSGNDLVVTVEGTTNVTTIEGWFAAAGNQVDRIRCAASDSSQGYAIGADQVNALVSVMAGFSPSDLQSAISNPSSVLGVTVRSAWKMP
jgi:Ca2+-binding RTX toxin-like protein